MISTALSPTAKFAPTDPQFLKILVQDLKLRFNNTDFKFLDIGAGNGIVITKVVRKHPNAYATGIEFNRLLYLWGYFLINTACLSPVLHKKCKNRIKWMFADAFKLPAKFYQQFDAIYVFTQMFRLKQYKNVLNSLKPGAIVYSLYFKIPKEGINQQRSTHKTVKQTDHKQFCLIKTHKSLGRILYVYKIVLH